MYKLLISLMVMMMSASAMAGSCDLTINRKACPGQEAKAMKPYNGVNPTVEKSTVGDAGACEKAAEAASKIVRKGTLTEKKVSGQFDGKALAKEYSDKAECK